MSLVKVCPRCKSMLSKTLSDNVVCKLCGYVNKQLKVADEDNFGARINCANRIYIRKTGRLDAKQKLLVDKMEVYLTAYQKLHRDSLEILFDKEGMSNNKQYQGRVYLRECWFSYLKKASQEKRQIIGIFRKFVNRDEVAVPTLKDETGSDSDDQSEEDEQSNIPNQTVGKSPGKLNPCSQFKQFFRRQIRPIINCHKDITQSLQDKLIDQVWHKGKEDISEQYLALVSKRYVWLLMVTGYCSDNKESANCAKYIPEKLVREMINRRKERGFARKQDNIQLLLLHDLLLRWAQNSAPQVRGSIQELARLYSQGEESIPIISTLIKGLLHKTLVTEKQTSTNIPELSFLLVFSLLHLVFLKLGSTMTISELIVALGRLQISSIKLEGEISLPVPINEELVTVKRVRRLSIKLAIYIGVQIDIQPSKWAIKFCKLFGIEQIAAPVAYLSALLNQDRSGSKNDQDIAQSVKQDVFALATIVIYIKLAVGLDPYPYLANINCNLLRQKYLINQSSIFQQILKLFQEGQLRLQEGKQVKRLPLYCKSPLDLGKIMENLLSLQQSHPVFGRYALNSRKAVLNDYSCLEGVTARNMCDIYRNCKELIERRSGQEKSDHIVLKYRKQALINALRVNKELKDNCKKLASNYGSQLAVETIKKEVLLKREVIEQYSCQVDGLMVPETQGERQDKEMKDESMNSVQFKLDEPSSCYEIIAEHAQDTLQMIGRQQLACLLETICLNICSYNQLVECLQYNERRLLAYE